MDIILDTETTGLKPEIDELLQVSIIDTNGVILLNEYIKPDRATEWTDAMRINQITPEMVAHAPSIRDPYLHAKIQHILNNADKVIGYNTIFDIAFLAAAGFDVPNNDELTDVMIDFAEKYGELRDDGSYKWQKLTTAAAYYGYEWPVGAHNSLGDCLATLHVYNCMHKKIVTNGDKIRAMTDEELADWLTDDHDKCDICKLCSFGSCRVESECEEGVLEWLKSEVEWK